MPAAELPWWDLFSEVCTEGGVTPDQVPQRVITAAVCGYVGQVARLPVRGRTEKYGELVLTVKGGRRLTRAEESRAREAIGRSLGAMWSSEYAYCMVDPRARAHPTGYEERPEIPIMVPERHAGIARDVLRARLHGAFPTRFPDPALRKRELMARAWLGRNRTMLRLVSKILGRAVVLDVLEAR